MIVVGNGMAATRFLEEWLACRCDSLSVTVFGAEALPGYNRVMLSPLLAGEKTFTDIVTHPYSWYQARGVSLNAGSRIIRIDRDRRLVVSEEGEHYHYDHLVLATGSRPRRPDIPGVQYARVFCFRDLEDTNRLAALAGQDVVVVGGGLLGLEAAAGLLQRGVRVTLLHEADWLLNRQLDCDAGELLQSVLERRGLRIVTGAKTVEVLGDETVPTEGEDPAMIPTVRGIRLADGRTVACHAVVFATGVIPDVELARSAGLNVDKGILVDDFMRTSDPRVSAVGECTQWRGRTFGMVAPLYDQARVCALRLAGVDAPAFTEKPLAATLKVSGVQLYSCGEVGQAGCDVVRYSDPASDVINTVWIRDDRIVGAVMLGDVSRGPACFSRVQSGVPLGDKRDGWLLSQHA
jgi:nitrite reductase (NADH) large subunit